MDKRKRTGKKKKKKRNKEKAKNAFPFAPNNFHPRNKIGRNDCYFSDPYN